MYHQLAFVVIDNDETQEEQETTANEREREKEDQYVVVALHPLFLPHTHIEISLYFLFRYTIFALVPPDELSPERDRVIKSTRG